MKIGLVLEGGGMRCLYTAGILDCFLDQGIEIKNCYGVSGGAMCGMNYVSKQRERTFRSVVNYMHDKNYCSVRNLLKTGNLFGSDMLYNRIPNELDPFDYDTFAQSDSKLTVVYSDVVTGMPSYKKLGDMHQDMVYLKASCALPMVSRMVVIDDKRYLDGGITDSIPLVKAMQETTYQVVILSRHREYRKKPESFLATAVGKLMYYRYHNLVKAGINRHSHYNQQRSLVWEQATQGKALVFCPNSTYEVSRTEKNTARLTDLYLHGYEEANKRLNEVKDFIKQAERCKW